MSKRSNKRTAKTTSRQRTQKVYVQNPPCRCGTCVQGVNKQVGDSHRQLDVKLDALPPGVRISKYGGKYYESRKNRSDLKGRL